MIYQDCDPPIIQVWGTKFPCTEFPNSLEVDEILSQHSDILEKIEAMDGGDGTIFFEKYELEECPGKSSVTVYHASVTQCHEIKKIINSDTFFGIPYSLANI